MFYPCDQVIIDMEICGRKGNIGRIIGKKDNNIFIVDYDGDQYDIPASKLELYKRVDLIFSRREIYA